MVDFRIVKFASLGVMPYASVLRSMRAYVSSTVSTHHALWFVEHPSIYSLGQRQRNDSNFLHGAFPQIEVVVSDRGGLTTYHGPDQLIFYCLFHLPSLSIGIKQFIFLLEQSVIDMLTPYGVLAHRIVDRPGVYINERKVASLGVKVIKGWSYHGVACNFDMDLTPFSAIDPCGWQGLEMCNVVDYAPYATKQEVATGWVASLCELFQLEPIESDFSEMMNI